MATSKSTIKQIHTKAFLTLNYRMRRKCPARVEVALTTDKEGRKGQSSAVGSELRTRGCKEGCGAKRMKEHFKQRSHPAGEGFSRSQKRSWSSGPGVGWRRVGGGGRDGRESD